MILDTNFIIDIMRNNESAINKSKQLSDIGESQFITSLTIFELFSGL